ncbi:hypothetical protein E0L20_16320 [Enterobacter wuhouensis]|uniref:Uncharacterized protein n=1 Tax=Enterobacter wuhouensis TaxID=2529381 RepID=A0A4R0G5E6_9ENTR|nr:hypothetical protein E0L20_16320 [Enterobacter wuhouensis]
MVVSYIHFLSTFPPATTQKMSKLYSTHHSLTAIGITKIALPKSNLQKCDSAIKLSSRYEITAKKGI